MTSSGAMPPNTNTMLISGMDARTSRSTKASDETSLPMTIPNVLTGVLINRSRVCFSRSMEIEPLVNAGASSNVRMVWTTRIVVKIACPISVDSEPDTTSTGAGIPRISASNRARSYITR
jgi:hypothetical protein